MADNPYHPVTTVADTTHLAEDEWGLTTNVIYAKPRQKRFKSACEGLNKTPRCAIIIFITVCLLILLCVIIAVAASGSESSRHPTGSEPMRQQKKLGLNFYPIPEDKSIVIRFKEHKFRNDEAIITSMDAVLRPYEHTHQLNETKFKNCSPNDSPKNMTCMFPMVRFGEQCTQKRGYGYNQNLPCVLLQLELPIDTVVKPIDEGGPLWDEVKKVEGLMDRMEADTSAIPVTCEGATNIDRQIFAHTKAVSSDGKQIRFFPKPSLPSYFYRARDLSKDFIKPAVMLQFTSLLEKHITHVRCTLWAQAFSTSGVMVQHGLMETEFAIYIED